MRRIAVINQKGGVGKTTTTVNLGAALAQQGWRVLVADLDPQCNLSVHLAQDPETEQPTVYDLLTGRATLAEVVRPTRVPKLWVLPSGADLAGVELELVNTVGREVVLRDAFEAADAAGAAPWDIVLVDCPPSLGLLALNALVLCDEVLVPIQAEFFALQGLSKLMEVVDLVRRRLNPRLHIGALVSCRHDPSTNLGRQVLDDIRAHFGDVLLTSVIRRNVKLAEAPGYGQTIFEYDPTSRGAEDYLRLAHELMRDAVEPAAAASAAESAAPAAPAAAKPAARAAPRPAAGAIERAPQETQEPPESARTGRVPAAASAPAPRARRRSVGPASRDASAAPIGDAESC